MKRIYEVQVYRETYWVEAASVIAAAKAGRKIADRDVYSKTDAAPRVESVLEKGRVDVRA